MGSAPPERPRAPGARGAAWPLLALSSFAVLSCADDPYRTACDRSRSSEERALRLDGRLRELLGAPVDSGSWLESVDSVGRILSARIPSDASLDDRTETLAAWFAGPDGIRPVSHPDDTDLVPSLAWQRRRGGCTSLAFLWRRLGARVGLSLDPILLPGHLALRRGDGRLVEPLRDGILRSPEFYDSAFGLARRPFYRVDSIRPAGIEAAMALQAGLLEWKRGDLGAAESALRAASTLAPGLPEAEGDLGLLLEARGRDEEAKVRIARALSGDSTNRAARERLEGLEARGTTSWIGRVVAWIVGRTSGTEGSGG